MNEIKQKLLRKNYGFFAVAKIAAIYCNFNQILRTVAEIPFECGPLFISCKISANDGTTAKQHHSTDVHNIYERPYKTDKINESNDFVLLHQSIHYRFRIALLKRVLVQQNAKHKFIYVFTYFFSFQNVFKRSIYR